MSNEENNPQPGMMPFAAGFGANQMFFPQAAPAPQLGAMQQNGQPQNPQMMTMQGMQMFYNAYMHFHQQMFMAQFACAAGGFNPMMAGQMQMLAGQVPNMAAGQTNGAGCVPMLAPPPMMQYGMMPMQMATDGQWPAHCPLPAPIPLKIEGEELSAGRAHKLAFGADPSTPAIAIKQEMVDDDSDIIELPPPPRDHSTPKNSSRSAPQFLRLGLMGEGPSPPEIKLEEPSAQQALSQCNTSSTIADTRSTRLVLPPPSTLHRDSPESPPPPQPLKRHYSKMEASDSPVVLHSPASPDPLKKKSPAAAREKKDAKLSLQLTSQSQISREDKEKQERREKKRERKRAAAAAAEASAAAAEKKEGSQQQPDSVLPSPRSNRKSEARSEPRKEKRAPFTAFSIKSYSHPRLRIDDSEEEDDAPQIVPSPPQMDSTSVKATREAANPPTEEKATVVQSIRDEPPEETKASNTPNAPYVPPRFPKKRPIDETNISQGGEGDKHTKRPRSPSRSEESLIGEEGGGRAIVNAKSILVKGVPLEMDRERVRSYFSTKFGACSLSERVSNEPPTTVRIRFESRRSKHEAFHRNGNPKLRISLVDMTIHEDVMESVEEMEREEEKEKERENEREERRRQLHSAALAKLNEESGKKIVSELAEAEEKRRREKEEKRRGGEEREMEETPLPPVPLRKYTRMCGQYRDGVLLTAGPLPPDCPLPAVLAYFHKLECEIFWTPFPSPDRPHEYLILRFVSFLVAKRILAATEHRINKDFVVPVSPPYDVHLGLGTFKELREEDCLEMQRQFGGAIASLPYVQTKNDMSSFGFITLARPFEALNAIARSHFNINGIRLRVFPSTSNATYTPFKDIWETKCALERKMKDVREKAERALKVASEKKNSEEKRKKERAVQKVAIEDYSMPLLTVGPIPDHCLAECVEYLLSTFSAVYDLPYVFPTNANFRMIVVQGEQLISALLSEGFVYFGRQKQEKVLVSPPFDVTFCQRGSGKGLSVNELVDHMQRRFGPIVRRPFAQKSGLVVSFGRIQDALAAISASPHFDSTRIEAVEALHNPSFRPFTKSVDQRLLLDRAREADRVMKVAALVSRVVQGKIGEGGGIDELKVVVRSRHVTQWLPNQATLMTHLQRMGSIVSFHLINPHQGVVQFAMHSQARAVLETRGAHVAGVSVHFLPYSPM